MSCDGCEAKGELGFASWVTREDPPRHFCHDCVVELRGISFTALPLRAGEK